MVRLNMRYNFFFDCWLSLCQVFLYLKIPLECCEQYWTSPEASTPQSTSSTTTNHPSRKLSRLDEPDMQDTAREVRAISCDVLLWTPSHGWAKARRPAWTCIHQLSADTEYRPEDLPEAIRTIRRGDENGSGLSVLIARHDDDDDDWRKISVGLTAKFLKYL